MPTFYSETGVTSRTWFMTAALVGVVVGGTACNDLVGHQPATAGSTDPTQYENAEGALLKVSGVRGLFGEASNLMLLNSGMLADEFTDVDQNRGNAIDVRDLPEATGSPGGDLYGILQNLRVQSALAVIALRRAFPDSMRAERAEMFAIRGYAEIMLADAFCSGIPLSMPREGADIDYRPGSPRDSVYADALIAFDSALALTPDTGRLGVLARVGRGRALLALDSVTQAAHAVSTVLTTDQYQMRTVVGVGLLNGRIENTDFGNYSVADREGQVGLAFRSSGDPRTRAGAIEISIRAPSGTPQTFLTYYPLKYPQALGDSTLYTPANGIEARLIEAEAELRANHVAQWLSILNDLRTTGNVNGTVDVYACDVARDPLSDACPGDSTYARTDTVWEAGSGGVAGLRRLSDPGSILSGAAATKARVDTLFAERAAWMFATGHRQGDLRRLLRQYATIGESNVFPHGRYGLRGTYGSAVTFPIPTTESINKYYHGCLDRKP